MKQNKRPENNSLSPLKENNPLVSVVVATYNGERFIGEQLDSIIHQNYTNIEIIVVDDCSSDNTPKLLNEYAEKYANVKVFFNEQNLGYVKNFEKGFSLAKGELIAPSDQDDIWYLNKLEFLLEEINDNPIIYCDSELIDDTNFANGKKLSDIKRLTTYNRCINYSIGNSAPGHAMLIRKEIIDECFPFPSIIPHDYWIGFMATFYGDVKFIDKVLIKYRQHSENVFWCWEKKRWNTFK